MPPVEPEPDEPELPPMLPELLPGVRAAPLPLVLPLLPPVEPELAPEPALPPLVEPALPPELELPCLSTHLVRSAPVRPTHSLGVELAPALLLPEVPPALLPDEPEVPLAPCEDEAPLVPELPLLLDLSPAATAALARKAEKTAALMSFNVIWKTSWV